MAKLSEVSTVTKVPGGWLLFGDESKIGYWFTTNLTKLKKAQQLNWPGMPVMDDVEVAFMRENVLWVFGSGSVTKSGKDDQSRRMVVAVTDPMNDSARKIQVFKFFRETIAQATNAGPTSDLIKASIGKSSEIGGFNIEAGCAIKDFVVPGQSPMIHLGFRSPLVYGMIGDAIFVQIQFPERMLGQSQPMTAAQIGMSFYTLPLGGFGARGMYYDSQYERLFIVAGPVGDAEGQPFRLYVFNPETRQRLRLFELPQKIPGTKEGFHAEGITRDGKDIVIFPDSAITPPPSYRIKIESLI